VEVGVAVVLAAEVAASEVLGAAVPVAVEQAAVGSRRGHDDS